MLVDAGSRPRAGRSRRTCTRAHLSLVPTRLRRDGSRCVGPSMERAVRCGPVRAPLAPRRPPVRLPRDAGAGRRVVRVRLPRRRPGPADPAARRHALDLPRHVRPRRGGLPPRRHPGARRRLGAPALPRPRVRAGLRALDGWRRRGVLRHPVGDRGASPRSTAIRRTSSTRSPAGGRRTRATRPTPIRSSTRRSVHRAHPPDVPARGRH